MAADRKQLHLCAFMHTGPLSWRRPGAVTEGHMDFALYRRAAQAAERGLFDTLFIADNVALNLWLTGMAGADRIGNTVTFKPFTLLSALSTVTERIGLMATASTTYNHPFHIARKLASLDFLSDGRAGWNVVTSKTATEAANFGFSDEVQSVDRYVRANEFVDAVKGLWDSFDDDAFVRDRASGQFFDAAKMRALRHQGGEFRIAGPLNVPRPPQGHPVLCQAGHSEDGLNLAARTSDLIFNNKHTAEANRAFRETIRARAAAFGRDPDSLRYLPGVFVVVGGTEEEAQRKMRDARDAVDMPTAKRFLQPFLRSVEVEALDDDAPLPESEALARDAAAAGIVLEQDGRRLSVREICTAYGNFWRQLQVVGTPEQIAELMAAWLAADAADGFNVLTLDLVDGFTDFAEQVTPLLQKKGIFREGYEGRKLREHLGLPRPELC